MRASYFAFVIFVIRIFLDRLPFHDNILFSLINLPNKTCWEDEQKLRELSEKMRLMTHKLQRLIHMHNDS